MAQSIEDNNMCNLYRTICESFDLKEQDLRTYSPLTLAYIGDCVFDLVVKSVVVGRANCAANTLHKTATRYVKASSQSEMIDRILPMLDDTEKDILRRGRNAKSATMAKNASAADYRRATGLEALVGYLYLSGRMDRIVELVKTGMEID